MRQRRFVKAMMFVFAASVLVAGCRKTPKGTVGLGPGSDILDPTRIGESIDDAGLGLNERFAEGNRITDVSFENVMFGFDNYQVRSEETPKIEKVAAYMRANPKVLLVSEGHCDERGTREYNMSLGEHRALAVRAYLVGLGIDASRVQTRSFGKERPVDPGHSEAAWRLNRRVEFALYR